MLRLQVNMAHPCFVPRENISETPQKRETNKDSIAQPSLPEILKYDMKVMFRELTSCSR